MENYNKNIKKLKYISEDKKDLPHSWVSRINVVEMGIQQKQSNIQLLQIKLLTQFFHIPKNDNIQLYLETQKTQNS